MIFPPRDIQKKAFIAQWELAAKLNLPAIIHVREAFEDFFSYIKDLKKPAKVLLHCFSGNIEETKKAIELGFHFSIGGPLTFPKAELTREVFKIIPLDRIHLETDCPYLAPKPKRGKRNEPAFVKYTFEYMANLFNISEQTLSEQLADNANNFFNISLNK
jgi:TatD DNase family protein